MTNEEIIAEFELELLKNHLILTPEKLKIFRQAARNLWNNAEQAGFQRGIKTFIRSHGNETAEQKTASAILLKMNAYEEISRQNPNEILTYEVLWYKLKKHLSETEDNIFKRRQCYESGHHKLLR